MVPLKYICLFASFAVIQADLRKYFDLTHHGDGDEQLKQNLIKPISYDKEGLQSKQRTDLNDELNLFGDDRIPLDYGINEKSPEVKETRQDPQTGFGNIALKVVKDVLFNQPNTQYEYKECINAMANIVEEERLIKTLKNLTMDALNIISNASTMIAQCQKTDSFSACLVFAVNELGAVFVGVSEDIERAVMAILLVAQKLYDQIKLCIGSNDLPVATMFYSLLHEAQPNDSTHLKKDSASHEIPRVDLKPFQSPVHKRYPFLNRWFSNFDIN